MILLQFLVECLDAVVDALLLLGRQGLVLLSRTWSRPPRVLGAKARPAGVRTIVKRCCLSLLAECAQLGLLLLAHLLGDGAALLLVFLALEGLGDGRLQVLDELLHVLAELLALAGRHADGIGLVGLGEVVDVDPVVGSRAGRRPGSSGSRRWWSTCRCRWAPPRRCCSHRPRYPCRTRRKRRRESWPIISLRLRQFGTVLERQGGEIAGPIDLVGSEFSRFVCHVALRIEYSLLRDGINLPARTGEKQPWSGLRVHTDGESGVWQRGGYVRGGT